MKEKSGLDLNFVRRQFPGLNNGWILFDNAGGSQILSGVVDKIRDFLFTRNVQTGGTYELSRKAAEALYEGRTAMMDLINARRPEEIIFAASSTVALKNLARAMTRQLNAGDEIIVTNSDHESNIGPWVELEKKGLQLRVWELNKETLELELGDLKELLSEKTKLVCVTHVSNILGTINPIKEITRLVHEEGARICVDAVAFAPHRCLDVRELDVDYLVFSAYKTYGPHFAVLYGKYENLVGLDGLYHYFHREVPGKLEPGNPSYELAYSLTGITDYLGQLGKEKDSIREQIVEAFDLIAEHENNLGEKLLSYLRERPDCRIIGKPGGDDPNRVPTISFTLAGKDPGKIARRMEDHRLAVRYGDFYARRLIEYLGLADQNGVVRVSLVHYNTLEEVDRLINALEEVR
jgi:cysteine desulfurase family protein (TIGR01976 family)